MATAVIAPSMGEGIEELTLVKWLKKEGEAVEELESIVELETDKVANELPSPASGVVLKIISAENEVVKVGDILAWVGAEGEDIPKNPVDVDNLKKEESGFEEIENGKQPQEGQKETFLSPLVRKMLQEHQLAASAINGTGKSGRITKRDVLNYLESGKRGDSVISDADQRKTRISRAGQGRIEPMTNMRRTIAERMIQSLGTSAHVLTVMEADMSRVIEHRNAHKQEFAEENIRLTFTAYFIQALAAALYSHPRVNSSWRAEGLFLHSEINIGMAVALGEDGLIVPVIRNTDTLSLREIARKIYDLAERARAKKLLPEEVQDATFSLTNHGLSGSLFATPIIAQPQVGILGTGRIQKRAVVVSDAAGNDAIAICPMVYLSFVFDHRVLDGEGADKFLYGVKERLEKWE